MARVLRAEVEPRDRNRPGRVGDPATDEHARRELRVDAASIPPHLDDVRLVEEVLAVPPLRDQARSARGARAEEDPDSSPGRHRDSIVAKRVSPRPDDELAAGQRRVVHVYADPGERDGAIGVADVARQDEAGREPSVDLELIGRHVERICAHEVRLVVPPLADERRPRRRRELDLHETAEWKKVAIVPGRVGLAPLNELAAGQRRAR